MDHPKPASPWEATSITSQTGGEAALYEAVLVPHRSLSRAGFFVVLGGLAVICLGAGLIFFFVGAWPVVGFLGLDILLVYFAFRTSYAHAGLVEEIRLTARELGVRRSWPRGQVQIWSLEPYWAQVDLEGPADAPDTLTLRSKGVTVRIGGFLSAAERAVLACELRAALSDARA